MRIFLVTCWVLLALCMTFTVTLYAGALDEYIDTRHAPVMQTDTDTECICEEDKELKPLSRSRSKSKRY